MEFCHIAPTAHLSDFCSRQTHHLLLAHLVEGDRVYKEWYQNHKNNNPTNTYILDNSAFELYKQGRPMYDSNKLIDVGHQCSADYIVMSDYPGENWMKTVNAAEQLAPKFKENGFGTFFCPQSEIGKVADLVQSYRHAATNPMIDYIGFSILAIPNAYGVERDNRLQRFLARWRFVQLLKDTGVVDLIRQNNKKVHFLGMVDGPNEIMLLGDFVNDITTWDSSAAVWAGLNLIKFDNSPTGLIGGKFEKHVDFNFKTTDYRLIDTAKSNVTYINMLAERFTL